MDFAGTFPRRRSASLIVSASRVFGRCSFRAAFAECMARAYLLGIWPKAANTSSERIVSSDFCPAIMHVISGSRNYVFLYGDELRLSAERTTIKA